MKRLAHTAPFMLAVAALSATAFLATGCTIYTYEGPPPKSRPAKTKPAKTSSTKPAKGPIVTRPSGGTQGGTGTSTSGTPTVKARTIFGTPTVGAFKGEAFVIPEGTQSMPNFNELVPFAILYTDQFNVSPQTFSGGFPGALLQDEWFAIRYQGKIAMPASGRVTLKLVSDDGAVLYIDGKKVLDNDGVHTARTVTGDVTLSGGQHDLQLDYFQEKRGSVALQLFIVAAGQDVPLVGVR